MGKVFFELTVPIKIKKEADGFVACCPVLDLYAQGNTEAAAKKNMFVTVQLFITSCFERGTLDSVLKECGFHAIKGGGAVPKDHGFIKVPIPFNVTGGCPTECHA